MRFRGFNNVSMDAKGRFSLPTRYRDTLQAAADGCVVVTVDPDQPCLLLYPRPEFESIEDEISKLPNTLDGVRRLQRLFIGYASEVQLDANGRLLLDAGQRSYAGLEKKLVLVGQTNKVEIWAEDRWQAYLSRDETDDSSAAVMSQLKI